MLRFQDRGGRWWQADYEPPGGSIGWGPNAIPDPPRVRGRIVFRAEDGGEVRECGVGDEFGFAVAKGTADEIALLSALATSTARR